jgi:hypothetical protein
VESILRDTLALYDDAGRTVHRQDIGGAAFIAHGWYSAVCDMARAAALLDDSRLDHVASPLRRSMAEHALALRWLRDEHEAAIESLRQAQQHAVMKFQAATAAGSWNIPEDVFENLLSPAASGSSENVNLHFTNLARALGEPDLLAAWLHETATCHPSLASASRYTQTWPGAETSGVGAPPTPPSDGRAQAVLLLLLAAKAFNEFLDGTPWTAPLAKLEGRFLAVIRAPKQRASTSE